VNPFEEYLDRCVYARTPEQGPLDRLDLELLQQCLEYSRDTGEPLPVELLKDMIIEIRMLRSGRESELFNEGKHKPKLHPTAEGLERDAVSYILTCQKQKLDPHPVKTICMAYGVANSTVHRWKDQYKDSATDSLPRGRLEGVRDEWGGLYQQYLKETPKHWIK